MLMMYSISAVVAWARDRTVEGARSCGTSYPSWPAVEVRKGVHPEMLWASNGLVGIVCRS